MDITLDLAPIERLAALWRRSPEIVDRHLRAALQESLLLLQRETAEATPTGAHQLLRKSIVAEPIEEFSGGGLLGVVDVQDRATGKYGSVLNYALAVELGTKPHRPPVLPLVDWVKAKFGLKGEEAEGAAHAIAWKIFHRGTEGRHMFRDTLARLAPAIDARFERAVDGILAELGAV